ncbi:MAG: hypothetical protein KBS41_03670 [Oscillospiraceae bacterium]|nr:hypothetical protein [Candidatus Equicaccousia limihippi]
MRKTKTDKTYHIYDITKKLRDTAHRVNDVGRLSKSFALENGISNDIVRQDATKSQQKFSNGYVTNPSTAKAVMTEDRINSLIEYSVADTFTRPKDEHHFPVRENITAALRQHNLTVRSNITVSASEP